MGRAKCADDIRQTVMFLSESLNNNSYSLFVDYVGWLKVLFVKLGIAVEDLADSLDCLGYVVEGSLVGPDGVNAAAILKKARESLDSLPIDTVSLITGASPTSALARNYLDALLSGDKRRASRLILTNVSAGMSIKEVYLGVFEPVLREVGRLWHSNIITVADEHFVTAATQATMSQLYPYIFTGRSLGRAMVATCVSGELHEIGMRMVADCFELAGWDTYYLGANVPSKDVISILRQKGAAVLGISATLTRHLGQVSDLVTKVRSEVGSSLIILVGGYPFNIEPELWRRVGADGMAFDAATAVEVVSAIESTL
jgi:methanogenic corrinoid protein MtbC1